MIPAGILSQNRRDLSKEIWISWGNGYTQDGQVYCNAINYLTQDSWITLKNAKGDDTAFQLYQMSWGSEGGLEVTTTSTGTLDIINRRSLVMYDDYEEFGFYGALVLRNTGSSVNVDLNILNGRNLYGNGIISGWGLNNTITATTPPVQTKMEVTDDWETYSSLTTSVYQLNIRTEYNSYQIRAIVIKLL